MQRLRVRVHGGTPDWPAGVTPIGDDVVELGAGVGDAEVLDAALRAGTLREFTCVRPTLAELFREVVAA